MAARSKSAAAGPAPPARHSCDHQRKRSGVEYREKGFPRSHAEPRLDRRGECPHRLSFRGRGQRPPRRFRQGAGRVDAGRAPARSTTAVRALLAETRTIPIVFVSVSDPVGEKFAASLARPGGNATGFTNVEATMGGKWLELLKEVAPLLRRVGILFNPRVAVAGGSFFLPPIEAAAPAFALTLNILPVHTVREMEQAVAALAREPNSALVVPPDVFIVANRASVIELAARHRLPAVYAFRNMAVEGGLMSYGVDVADLYRRSAAYVDRILKGDKPGELPIQAPTRFELVLNLKTAKSIGLEVSREFLLRTDEVIE